MATGSQSGWLREGGRRHAGGERREQMTVQDYRTEENGQCGTEKLWGEKKEASFFPLNVKNCFPLATSAC